jgi:hypothetical protein
MSPAGPPAPRRDPRQQGGRPRLRGRSAPAAPPARRRASARERSSRRPNICRFSRPVRISSTAANCPVRPSISRTAGASLTTSRPNTPACPEPGASTRTSVVFPAPASRSQPGLAGGLRRLARPRRRQNDDAHGIPARCEVPMSARTSPGSSAGAIRLERHRPGIGLPATVNRQAWKEISQSADKPDLDGQRLDRKRADVHAGGYRMSSGAQRKLHPVTRGRPLAPALPTRCARGPAIC